MFRLRLGRKQAGIWPEIHLGRRAFRGRSSPEPWSRRSPLVSALSAPKRGISLYKQIVREQRAPPRRHWRRWSASGQLASPLFSRESSAARPGHLARMNRACWRISAFPAPLQRFSKESVMARPEPHRRDGIKPQIPPMITGKESGPICGICGDFRRSYSWPCQPHREDEKRASVAHHRSSVVYFRRRSSGKWRNLNC